MVSFDRELGQVLSLLSVDFLESENPVRDGASRDLEHIPETSQEGLIQIREESYGLSLPIRSPRSPDSVNVVDNSLREIVVYDEINALKIYSPSHEVSTNQSPEFSGSEILNDLFSL